MQETGRSGSRWRFSLSMHEINEVNKYFWVQGGEKKRGKKTHNTHNMSSFAINVCTWHRPRQSACPPPPVGWRKSRGGRGEGRSLARCGQTQEAEAAGALLSPAWKGNQSALLQSAGNHASGAAEWPSEAATRRKKKYKSMTQLCRATTKRGLSLSQ